MARPTLNDQPQHGSILMHGAAIRLGGAAALVLLLWLAVAWALL